jgi:hypothetical protein
MTMTMTSELEKEYENIRNTTVYRRFCDHCRMEYNEFDPPWPGYDKPQQHLCLMDARVVVGSKSRLFAMKRPMHVAIHGSLDGVDAALMGMRDAFDKFINVYSGNLLNRAYEQGLAAQRNPLIEAMLYLSLGVHEADRDERIRNGQEKNGIVPYTAPPLFRTDHYSKQFESPLDVGWSITAPHPGTRIYEYPPQRVHADIADRINTIRVGECSSMDFPEYVARRLIVDWPEPGDGSG